MRVDIHCAHMVSLWNVPNMQGQRTSLIVKSKKGENQAWPVVERDESKPMSAREDGEARTLLTDSPLSRNGCSATAQGGLRTGSDGTR